MGIHVSGTLIANRYEIVQGPLEKPSLSGGMGLVYLCVDREDNGRPVALKTFKPEYLPNRAARDLFLREGTMWVELGCHPHIVRCYEVIRPDFGLEVYFVLELVAADEGKDNPSLRAWLTSGKPLPVEQALRFALHIARGMKHATTKIPSLVHRDLKPENILVGHDGNARVTDFGLAGVLEILKDQAGASNRLRPDEDPAGTPEYMAPEQWERWDVDMRADIYAFGCILEEMLTGQMPVKVRPRKACCELHQSGQALKVARSLLEVFQPLLARCLAVRPDERFANWMEVETAIARVYQAITGRDAPATISRSEATHFERVAVGWSLNTIGVAYRHIGKFDIAARYFERVVRIGQTEKRRDLEGAGLGNLGNIYRNLGNTQRAIEFYKQALAIAQELKDIEGTINALGGLGNAYLSLGNVQQAIEFYDLTLNVARVYGDRGGEGRALNNLGHIYRRLGFAGQAIEFYQKALTIAKETTDRLMEEDAVHSLGNAYLNLGQMLQAIEFYKQALTIARGIGDRTGEGKILHNLGNAYQALSDMQQAIWFYEQALAIAREVGNRAGEGGILNDLGRAYHALGDTPRAIEFYKQALAITHAIGDLMGTAEINFNLGSLLFEQGQVIEALSHAQYAMQVFAQVGDLLHAQIAQQLIAQIRARQQVVEPAHKERSNDDVEARHDIA